MGFENLDIKYYEKNGYLSEKDYNSLGRKLSKVINPLRVSDIRKVMEFLPISYSDYIKDMKNEAYCEDNSSIQFGKGFVGVFLSSSFNSNYFPNFDQEYSNPWGPVILHRDYTVIDEIGEEGLKFVPNGNYHSLAIAAYNIEKEIKSLCDTREILQISEDISVLVEFFVPTNTSGNYDTTVKVTILLY